MIIRPVFNILLLPDITYFFKRDFFPGLLQTRLKSVQIFCFHF